MACNVMPEKKTVQIYTDGACSGNPGPGGWGAVLMYGNVRKELSGSDADTTNNRMELMAAIEGMKALKMPCRVELYTDSAYLHDAFANGWIWSWLKNNWKKSDKKPVLNVDLWKELLELSSLHEIHWHKVKGHADNALNNRCDELARGAIDKIRSEVQCDEEYKVFISVAHFENLGAYSAFVVHEKACDRLHDKSSNTTAMRMELNAVIRCLSTISHSSIVGIYFTQNSLCDIFENKTSISENYSTDLVRLSEIIMAHDIRLHKFEFENAADSRMMNECDEHAKNQLTELCMHAADSCNMPFYKLYISAKETETQTAWCSLLSDGNLNRVYSDSASSTTKNAIRLQGIIHTLSVLSEPSYIEINTDSAYLYDTATLWLKRWETNGWKKANGQSVLHSELWSEINKFSSYHKLIWRKHDKTAQEPHLQRCYNKADSLLQNIN